MTFYESADWEQQYKEWEAAYVHYVLRAIDRDPQQEVGKLRQIVEAANQEKSSIMSKVRGWLQRRAGAMDNDVAWYWDRLIRYKRYNDSKQWVLTHIVEPLEVMAQDYELSHVRAAAAWKRIEAERAEEMLRNLVVRREEQRKYDAKEQVKTLLGPRGEYLQNPAEAFVGLEDVDHLIVSLGHSCNTWVIWVHGMEPRRYREYHPKGQWPDPSVMEVSRAVPGGWEVLEQIEEYEGPSAYRTASDALCMLLHEKRTDDNRAPSQEGPTL